MNPIEPRPALVQTEDGREKCRAIYKWVLSGDEKEAKSAADNLETFRQFGIVLSEHRKRVPHGQWGAELQTLGVPPRMASEAIRCSLMSPMLLAQLGSKTALRKYWAENPPEDDIDRDCGVEEEETKSAGGADLPETGGGSSRGARTRKGKRSGGTGPSPKSQQQTLALDPEEAQERLEKEMRRFCREAAEEIEELHKQFQQKLRLHTKAAEELKEKASLRGPLFRIDKVAAPEAAAGFEEKQETDSYEWRALTTLLNMLASVGGKGE